MKLYLHNKQKPSKYVLVDSKNYNFLIKFPWQASKNKNGKYYATCKIKGKTFSMSRLVMKTPKGLECNHIRDTLDNREKFLENVTKKQHRELHKERQISNNYKGVKIFFSNHYFRSRIVIENIIPEKDIKHAEKLCAKGYDAAIKAMYCNDVIIKENLLNFSDKKVK